MLLLESESCAIFSMRTWLWEVDFRRLGWEWGREFECNVTDLYYCCVLKSGILLKKKHGFASILFLLEANNKFH